MSATAHNTGRFALLLAEYVTGEHASEQLLTISQEHDAWSTYYSQTVTIHPVNGSAQAAKLSGGTVNQAAAVARCSKDPNLLLKMARKDKRRGVRAPLAANVHLPADAIALLWAKERADAGNTGADVDVLADLIRKLPAEQAVEHFLEALTFSLTTGGGTGALSKLVRAVSTAVSASHGAKSALALLETLDTQPRDQVTELYTAIHTLNVWAGASSVTVDQWFDAVDKLTSQQVRASAAAASWVAAVRQPDITSHPRWLPTAAQAWSHIDVTSRNSVLQWHNDWLWRKLLDHNGEQLAWMLTAMPTAVAVDLARQANPVLIDLLVRNSKALDLDAWRAIACDNPHRVAVHEQYPQMIREADTVEQVQLMLEAAPPQNGANAVIEAAWSYVVSMRELPFPLAADITRRSSKALLAAWATGVNQPKTVEQWHTVVASNDPDNQSNVAWVAAERCISGWSESSPELADHVWRHTAGLAPLIATGYGRHVREYTAEKLTEALGDDAQKWDTVVRLWNDWTATIGQLLDVVETLEQ